MTDPEVRRLLNRVPEFTDRYLALVEETDGDPGAAATFVELADFVAGLVNEIERFRPALIRCLEALEQVANSSEDAEDLVVWSFFDGLSSDDVRGIELLIGPSTRARVDAADRTSPW